MTAVTPIQPTRPISSSGEADADAAAVATAQPMVSAIVPDGTTPSSLTHLVPTGGLHPVAHEPGTALFSFFTEKLRAAMNKGSSGDPFKSMGEGALPAAKAAGKALGQVSAQ